MGIGLWVLSPQCEIGISRRSVYQMTTSREQARGEGNCERTSDPQKQANRLGKSRKGPWHMPKTIASGVGMTHAWLVSQGVLSLKTLWAELAPLRRTARCGPACRGGVGRVPGNGHPYPISFSVIASTASPRCRSYYFPYEFISGSTNCFTENRGSNIPVTGNNIPFECRRRKII
jgi:hypothetical protein